MDSMGGCPYGTPQHYLKAILTFNHVSSVWSAGARTAHAAAHDLQEYRREFGWHLHRPDERLDGGAGGMNNPTNID